jgi:hypothetical protein
MRARSHWRPGGLVAVAATALTVWLAAPAAASPSDQPGGTSGVLDSTPLDDLQKRAVKVQHGLQAQQAEIVTARRAQEKAQAAVEAAQRVLTDAQGELARYRQAVAGYAAAVYRDGGALTPLTVLLSAPTRPTWSAPWGTWRPSTRTPLRSSAPPRSAAGPHSASSAAPRPPSPRHAGRPTGWRPG